MYLYPTNNIQNEIEDLDDYDITYDSFIYTNDGIYKKYKKHFYKLDINENVQYVKHNNVNFMVQTNDYDINKNHILTSIPFKHFYVTRKTIKSNLSDNIVFIRELENDIYENKYFMISNCEPQTLDQICLFLDNKV